MPIEKLSNKLAQAGLPLFWQYFVAVHFLLNLVLFVVTEPFWAYLITIILKLLTVVGVVAGYVIHKRKAYPWLFLVIAVAVIATSVILQSFIHFGLSINAEIPYWIEQAGIFFIILFGINILLLFEIRNNLQGFTLDYTLLALSLFSLVFLISPDYLNTFLNEQTIFEQMSLLHLIVAAGVTSLVLLYISLIISFHLKDVVLTLLVLSVAIHFIIDSSITFNLIENTQFSQRFSLTLYHLAGSFAIITIFVENLDLKFVHRTTNKTSIFFLLVASTFSLTAVPLGIIYRKVQGYPEINGLLLASVSLLLSLIVIFRFSFLIRNSNRQKKKLLNIALRDDLTESSNYLGFQEHYELTVKRNPLLIMINIEDFKSINDLYGRQFGNKVLKSLAKRLQSQKNITMVARINADTFLILLKANTDNIKHQYIKLHNELGVWDIIEKQRIAVPLTFGVSYNDQKINVETLFKQAEKALYIARQKRLSYILFSDEHITKELHRQELRGILQQAIDYNYLPVHFQPIYDVEDGSLKAIELLIRLQSKEHGLLLPGQFLEQAQSYGLLNSLTRVCIRMIAKNIDVLPKVTININVPSFMLDNVILLNEFINSFNELNLSTRRFCIEVMEDDKIPAEHLIDAVSRLKREGFSIAMDDFGTGYSSLSRLSMIPFDTVKIDRSLLLAASEGNKAILESAIRLIKRLGIGVVVEGVETMEHLKLIRLLGADSVQGFLLSKPIDISKTTKLPLNAANIIDAF